jgi:copper chaperone
MTTSYKVLGMTCGGCANGVEKAILAAVPGATVKASFQSGLVTVDMATAEQVKLAVEDAGFEFGGLASDTNGL